MKLFNFHAQWLDQLPAAFRRLCVETLICAHVKSSGFPAAFRRLCVETEDSDIDSPEVFPAAFRRLCVETRNTLVVGGQEGFQPPSGGCVLKLSRL